MNNSRWELVGEKCMLYAYTKQKPASRRQYDSLGPSNDDNEQVTTSLILLWLSSH